LQSDYIVLSLPYTNRTRQIINAERLRKLESSAFIVNVSRGELIDQEALIETLKENRIAGAALDVATPEPLPSDSRLWEMPNVILTPHASAYSAKNDDKRFRIFNRNLKLYLQGKPLENRVDFDAGY
jgi:phosphoglycerate dehydrogenase-like enzyme